MNNNNLGYFEHSSLIDEGLKASTSDYTLNQACTLLKLVWH